VRAAIFNTPRNITAGDRPDAAIREPSDAVGALLMSPAGAFITGGDLLMDGGVTASYFFGDLAPH
jgi:hypothetical protein